MRRDVNKLLTIVIGLFLLGWSPVGGAEKERPLAVQPTPQWVTPAVQAPRLQRRIFYSATAQSNVSYHIYSPEVYDAYVEQRFPVLYWLHGTGGGLIGIPQLVNHFDAAIRAGKMPPALIVFPNGMVESMWCDSKDGSVPMETVVVNELVPHIDGTFRTIASRESRLIEGFSMGGYGAARMGFKRHDVFDAVSMFGAGPLQPVFSPLIGPPNLAEARARVLLNVYGNDQEYFKAQSPWALAEQNTAALRGKTRVRQIVGGSDDLLMFNRDFDEHLTQLAIPHTFIEAPGIGHDVMGIFNALGEDNWEFYRSVFSPRVPPRVPPRIPRETPKTLPHRTPTGGGDGAPGQG